MEHCDTSLAKHIQAQMATPQLNWAELVRYLMDGAAGWCEREKAGSSERERKSERCIFRHAYIDALTSWQVSTLFTRAKKPRTAT